MREQRDAAEWRRLFGSVLETAPKDYQSRRQKFQQMREVFHQELGVLLAPSLREYLASQPQDTFQEKRELARRLDEHLESLGLTLLCPRTTRAARLVVDETSGDARGHFGLEIENEKGNRVRTFKAYRGVPQVNVLELVPKPRPQASSFQGRIGRQGSDPKER